MKHGGGGITVWGCINSRGVGHLKKVVGRLNARAYIDLLENCLIPSVHSLHATRLDFSAGGAKKAKGGVTR